MLYFSFSNCYTYAIVAMWRIKKFASCIYGTVAKDISLCAYVLSIFMYVCIYTHTYMYIIYMITNIHSVTGKPTFVWVLCWIQLISIKYASWAFFLLLKQRARVASGHTVHSVEHTLNFKRAKSTTSFWSQAEGMSTCLKAQGQPMLQGHTGGVSLRSNQHPSLKLLVPMLLLCIPWMLILIKSITVALQVITSFNSSLWAKQVVYGAKF